MSQRPDQRRFAVGDVVRVNLHGNIVTATIRKILHDTDRVRLKIDLGSNNTADIEPWQVLKY